MPNKIDVRVICSSRLSLSVHQEIYIMATAKPRQPKQLRTTASDAESQNTDSIVVIHDAMRLISSTVLTELRSHSIADGATFTRLQDMHRALIEEEYALQSVITKSAEAIRRLVSAMQDDILDVEPDTETENVLINASSTKKQAKKAAAKPDADDAKPKRKAKAKAAAK